LKEITVYGVVIGFIRVSCNARISGYANWWVRLPSNNFHQI